MGWEVRVDGRRQIKIVAWHGGGGERRGEGQGGDGGKEKGGSVLEVGRGRGWPGIEG